jgi:putative Holliday junction resolvase
MQEIQTTLRGRVLAIDLGERRIGLALSDPLRLTAQRLPTVERRNRREDMNYLKSLVRKNEVSMIIVGNPLHMDGSFGAASQVASEFADKLRKYLGLDVQLRDERLTSVEADRVLREAGLKSKQRAGLVDQLAAALLLENYLEAERQRADSGSRLDDQSE